MSQKPTSRRRSLSMTATAYRSQSETTSTSSSNKSKSNFLSRFKTPSSTTTATPIIKPSKSASTVNNSNALPPISGQQKVKRKPVVLNSMQSTFIHDSVISSSTSEDASKKAIDNHQSLGNLFRKTKSSNSKSIDKSSHEPIISKTDQGVQNFAKYELPPISYTNDMESLAFVNKIMGERQIPQYNKKVPDPPQHKVVETETIKLNQPVNKSSSYTSRWSAASRKSTGSYSIYSTFGTESVYSENESTEEVQELDLAQIVANNMQTRTPARVIPAEEETSDDNDTDDDDDDDDVFVDATGMSQEDIEKEDRRLSKRLSGGHFGSAGGLLLSIEKRSSKPPPEDIAKSMINWKRKSGQNLTMFTFTEEPILQQVENVPEKNSRKSPPDILLEEEEEESVDNESGISKTSSDIKDPKDCASRLWQEDETFVQREQIAEWLGQSKPLNMATLQEYMSYFDFSKLRLDSAFRKVCSKLYFRAEAQQIDRILEAFAKRYWSCNPKSILGSSDIVYAVVYSLLLLNTDLHVAQGNYTRMSRQEFVRNTMSTVREQKQIELKKNPKSPSYIIAWEAHVEAYLKDMYVAVKSNQILQPMHHHNDYLNPDLANRRVSVLGGKRMVDIKRSLNTMMGRESSIDDSRRSTSSWHPISPNGSLHQDSLLSPNSTFSLEPSNNRPPYFKEGIVMRKHLLESQNQKAKHREWRECLLVVSQGEFKMFGIPGENNGENTSSRLHMLKSGGSSFVNLADSLSKSLMDSSPSPLKTNHTAYTQLIGTVALNHTLSNALPPPGYNRSRPYVFALQESNGGVNLIQCSSTDQVNEWVSTCNYWAARQSKEPLQGGVSNIEYGWGTCLHDVILDLDAVQKGKKITGKYIHHPDTVNISVWIPPSPTMISSVLDEKAQFQVLQKYVNYLNNEINEHREIKRKMMVKFHYKSQNQSKALTNWESKSTYMLHEIIKYQNYCDALEKSIAKRDIP